MRAGSEAQDPGSNTENPQMFDAGTWGRGDNAATTAVGRGTGEPEEDSGVVESYSSAGV